MCYHVGMSRKREITVPTDDDVQRLMDACKGNATGVRNRALIALLRYSGLRISEALALELRDVTEKVDRDGNAYAELHVRHGKGDEERRSVLTTNGLADVRRWIEAREALDVAADAPVFCVCNGKRKGAPLTRAYVDVMLKRLAYDAGFPAWQRAHAHAFRHAHATDLAHRGKKLVAIQRQLGHKHAYTTEMYLASLSAADLADEING